jgi:hypothetical protein
MGVGRYRVSRRGVGDPGGAAACAGRGLRGRRGTQRRAVYGDVCGGATAEVVGWRRLGSTGAPKKGRSPSGARPVGAVPRRHTQSGDGSTSPRGARKGGRVDAVGELTGGGEDGRPPRWRSQADAGGVIGGTRGERSDLGDMGDESAPMSGVKPSGSAALKASRAGRGPRVEAHQRGAAGNSAALKRWSSVGDAAEAQGQAALARKEVRQPAGAGAAQPAGTGVRDLRPRGAAP